MSSKLRVGVAGPVGSGKTALVETLCIGLKKRYKIAVVTNDIYTKEDANFLIKKKILEEGRIVGVETVVVLILQSEKIVHLIKMQ